MDRWLVVILTGMTGVVCAVTAGIDLYKMCTCTEQIQAQYIRYVTYSSYKGANSYGLLFGFSRNGVYYEKEAGRTCFKRKLRRFVEGQWYPVYINPNNPKLIRENRRLKLASIFMLLAAVIHIAIAVGVACGR